MPQGMVGSLAASSTAAPARMALTDDNLFSFSIADVTATSGLVEKLCVRERRGCAT